jgi:hypothetical protein
MVGEAPISEFIAVRNEPSKPFAWTKSARAILTSMGWLAFRTLALHGAKKYGRNHRHRRLVSLSKYRVERAPQKQRKSCRTAENHRRNIMRYSIARLELSRWKHLDQAAAPLFG